MTKPIRADTGDAADRGLARFATADDEVVGSPHAAQLQRGFRWLRFEPELEREFVAFFWGNYRRRTRAALYLGALLFSLFSWRDALTLPAQVWHWTVTVRMGLIVPTLLLAVPFTLRDIPPRRYDYYLYFCLLAVVGGQAAILLISDFAGSPLPYEGLLLVLAVIYFLTGIRLIRKAAVCLIVTAAYLAVSLVRESAEVTETRELYLAAMNLIGIIGGYFSEHLLRRTFLTEHVAEFRASRDTLTLLPNRRSFMQHFARAWRQAAGDGLPVSVLMIDADYFKAYNECYGHLAGDECLKRIAASMNAQLRQPLGMLARYGGEEFLGMIYGADEETTRRICEDLRSTVQALKLAHARSPEYACVTVSIGACWVKPTVYENLVYAVIDEADRALYQAKSRGRNCWEVRVAH